MFTRELTMMDIKYDVQQICSLESSPMWCSTLLSKGNILLMYVHILKNKDLFFRILTLDVHSSTNISLFLMYIFAYMCARTRTHTHIYLTMFDHPIQIQKIEPLNKNFCIRLNSSLSECYLNFHLMPTVFLNIFVHTWSGMNSRIMILSIPTTPYLVCRGWIRHFLFLGHTYS